MKRVLYNERDYSFGQTMLALRTAIGLTQSGLADQLGVSRRAVGEWEAGSSYPKAENLKQLIALAIEQRGFPAGREAEQACELWETTHQKIAFDEQWLSALLNQRRVPRSLVIPQRTEETCF